MLAARRHLPALAGLAALAAGWTALSWRRWPDLLIDYGRELYVPWRLSAGDVLYRDFAYHFGPLSAYVNAGIFKLTGAGFDVLCGANLVLTAALALLVYALALRWLSRPRAAVLSACFLCLMAFSHLQEVGNYNFVCPYAQPLTHGLLLAVLAAVAVVRFLDGGACGWMVAAHACVGLTLLCKPETFLAAAAAVAAGWWCAGQLDRLAGRRARWLVPACAAAALLPSVAFAALVWPAEPVHHWVTWCLTPYTLTRGITPQGRHFYEQISGLHAPLRSLGHVGIVALAEIAAIGLLCGLGRVTARAGSTGRWAALAIWTGLCSAAVVWVPRGLWLSLLRPLPLVMIAVVVVAVQRLGRGRSEGRREDHAALLVLSVLATALLLKIILRVQLDHYGFALACPAALIAVGLAIGKLPAWLGARTGNPLVSHAVVWIALAAFVTWHAAVSAGHYRAKTLACGRGRDRILADGEDAGGRNRILIEAVNTIEERLPASATVAALPDWAMLNYLTRRINPGRFHTATPFDVALFGEQAMLQDLQAHPPDCIVWCARDTSELGARTFGVDYAQTILAWILDHYVEERTIGAWPPDPQRFGVQILRLK